MGARVSKLFDLPHQLSFYASYHANPVYAPRAELAWSDLV